ncbi:MAG: GMP synthase [Chitinophagaceae bacterium]|nr:MAG: GMP synthase [Chitinophagaceae bacterium]
MTEKILILDFGSQYTQLIARAVREANIYCEIIPYHKPFEIDKTLKGIILSGSPFSVNDEKAPEVPVLEYINQLPVLGICYGAQMTAKLLGGRVDKSNKREYGRATMEIKQDDILFNQVSAKSQVWMSHSDSITSLPAGFSILATTESIPVAAFKKDGTDTNPLYGLQFHPEVYHSTEGKLMIKNFLVEICKCSQNWTPNSFVEETVAKLKEQIGDKQVIMALSGGVDSTVAATLIAKAIGNRLHGIFVDNGVLRKDEFQQVLDTYDSIGLNVKGIDAKQLFYDAPRKYFFFGAGYHLPRCY